MSVLRISSHGAIVVLYYGSLDLDELAGTQHVAWLPLLVLSGRALGH